MFHGALVLARLLHSSGCKALAEQTHTKVIHITYWFIQSPTARHLVQYNPHPVTGFITNRAWVVVLTSAKPCPSSAWIEMAELLQIYSITSTMRHNITILPGQCIFFTLVTGVTILHLQEVVDLLTNVYYLNDSTTYSITFLL